MPGEQPDRGLKAGKLPADILERLLSRLDAPNDPTVIIGPRPGEDAAVIDPGSGYVVAKMDPVTFATDNIGWYAVQVNANDIASTGGTPRWFLATLFLPEGTDPEVPEHIFTQLQQATADLGITLIGGHTEITVGLPRPMIAGAMLGEVERGRELSTSGAQPGDTLILTSGIAVEGTAILASECERQLLDAGVDRQAIEKAHNFLTAPGISVVTDARIALSAGEVHAMHDPTEGGLATGLLELAKASGTGLEIDASAVKVLPECAEFCDALQLHPWGLIASGALLMAAERSSADAILDALHEVGREAASIGKFIDSTAGMTVSGPDGIHELPVFERDEIARLMGD